MSRVRNDDCTARGQQRRSEQSKPKHRSGACWAPRSWRNGHSADTPDKARTARLQGEVNRCGANKKRLLLQNTRGGSDLLPARCPPCSRAVRALSGVSAPCPFLHERRDQPRMAVAGIKYSDPVHEANWCSCLAGLGAGSRHVACGPNSIQTSHAGSPLPSTGKSRGSGRPRRKSD